jgi:surfactin synthase thioesterase subunit
MDSAWFLREPSDSYRARLFCFPYSGCGASMYRAWPVAIDDVEVVALQLPGRENRLREGHYETYEKLADDLVEGIAHYLDRPYGFFGHCGGALPAYEVAVRVAERGLPRPTRLTVSSQVSPHDGPYGRYLGLTRDQLHTELRALYSEISGGVPPAPDLIDMLLDVLVADVEANKLYRKDSPVPANCPITAVGWDRDIEIPPALMGGWSECGDTRTVLLSGSHYTFLDAPSALLAELGSDLAATVDAG